MKYLYNALLFLYTVLMLPKWLWEMVRHKKHRKSFFNKFGFNLPQSEPCLWVHSVSVGETKAVAPLITKIQKESPGLPIVLSTTTETGLAEAKRSMPNLSAYFYLPLDFSWIVARLVRRLKPKLLILVESDFWYNLIQAVPTVVVNGKISETSLRRHLLFPAFSKPLFSTLAHLCIQNRYYADHFQALGVSSEKITITGNLKFDQPISQIDRAFWQQKLGLAETDRVITLASTHHPEEEQILSVLTPLLEHFPTLKIVLAPRHPERFVAVALLVQKFGPHVILVDTMGLLPTCFQLSELAIVGGSFCTHVGGHNIFEPILCGTPVLFGPYMETQQDLVRLVLQAKAGCQVELSGLARVVQTLLSSSTKELKNGGSLLAEESRGAVEKSYKIVKQLWLTN